MYLADIFTLPINIAGIPSISVPGGLIEGLPAGIQLMARPFDELSLLRAAYAFEEATPWHAQRAEV